MSQTDHLSIYKRSDDLCLYLDQVVRKFSRDDTYTLGTDLRQGCAVLEARERDSVG